MTLSRVAGVTDTHERYLARALQVVLIGIVLLGLYRRNIALLVNAGISLAITFVPAMLRREYGLPMDGGLILWVTTAVFLHALGAVWLYGVIWWYDQVAHALSATVVAAAGYAGARALDRHATGIEIPSEYMLVFLVVFILAFGVLWEIFEFASGLIARLISANAILAQHGIDDTAMDLIFDAIGGATVAVLNTPQLRAVADSLAQQVGIES